MSFVDFLSNVGPYSSEISDATAQRGRIRIALKGLKKEAQESRDYRLIINTIEDYLPYLFSIINCLEQGELKLLKQKNMADALNTAAGVFQYVANEVIPKWRQPSANRPVETIKELPTALSKMALADAQSTAISKALVSSNLSKSLIAKLYIGVAGQYEMAHGLISSISGGHEVSSDLKKYLSDGSQFYMAMAKKHLALDAYDSNKIGEALGFLRDCKADLRAVQHAGLSKPHIRKSAVAARAYKEEETVNELLQKYTNFNDKFSCQRVPSRQDLQRLIPSGRSVLELKRYNPPAPKFGPAKEDHSDSQTARYARDGSYF
ncbi:hypothetical protein DFQ28_008836 [Apophysomyces sp. BC1034]|nr:hypothetical protein DFQ28_008836 [Apophysomyces sp. BC1034]